MWWLRMKNIERRSSAFFYSSEEILYPVISPAVRICSFVVPIVLRSPFFTLLRNHFLTYSGVRLQLHHLEQIFGFTVDPRSNVFQRDLVKFVVRVKCCYSHYTIIKEKNPWGQIKMLLKADFCYRRIRWSGSPLQFKFSQKTDQPGIFSSICSEVMMERT